MTTLKAVLWDLDGTLVDSEEYHWQAWRDTMRAEGVEITRAQFRASFGQRNDRILRTWLGDDIAAERIARIGDAKEAQYRRLAEAHGVSPLPGAAEWVTRLRADGWRQAIATSAPRLNVDAMLRLLGLTACFDAIVSAEDVTKGKPDPDVFLTAASRLGVPPSRCVVVEDAAAGIEAARRAGMRAIGVSRTTTLDADVFVRSLADLDTWGQILNCHFFQGLTPMRPIGTVRSPYTATAQIPKGPDARHDAEGVLEIRPELEPGLQDVEGFSHLFVIWVFHRAEGYDLVSRPPTDDRPHGVFASRSPRRPNPIGLTVVELLRRDGPRLHVRGVDMLDGTPILDIKPYLSSIPPERLRRGWLAEI